ncbi:MAG: glycoside hydrolase family 16 protein, partial [Bacteroidaceae bacterium]|nr:glycoside hydrolase family 16 protein [Bacteroidaceae bacterium]
DTYHIYKMQRTATSITISIDGKEVKSFLLTLPSNHSKYFAGPFHMLFNLAVGGDFPQIFDAKDITALTEGKKARMYVDWVKIYEVRK